MGILKKAKVKARIRESDAWSNGFLYDSTNSSIVFVAAALVNTPTPRFLLHGRCFLLLMVVLIMLLLA